jgi:predicted porin
LIADGISKYDPQGASQAFSLIGLSGTAAGGGDTQDRRLDQSLKYIGSFSGVHVGAEYKFNGASGAANTAAQFQLGYDIGKIVSIDAFYSHIRDAVAAASLSAAQVAELPALGFSPSNSLAATISDNTTYGLMGMLSLGAPQLFAGYEHIKFANPSAPLQPGFDDIGGYKLAFVNNTAFDAARILQVYWAGVRLSVGPNFDVIGAYYGYHQNSFATGSHTGCSDGSSGGCSGIEHVVSVSGDYHFSKRFDVYAGAMYSAVQNGLASAFLSVNNVNPTLGLRFRF